MAYQQQQVALIVENALNANKKCKEPFIKRILKFQHRDLPLGEESAAAITTVREQLACKENNKENERMVNSAKKLKIIDSVKNGRFTFKKSRKPKKPVLPPQLLSRLHPIALRAVSLNI